MWLVYLHLFFFCSFFFYHPVIFICMYRINAIFISFKIVPILDIFYVDGFILFYCHFIVAEV